MKESKCVILVKENPDATPHGFDTDPKLAKALKAANVSKLFASVVWLTLAHMAQGMSGIPM